MESLRHALMVNRWTYDAASGTHLDTYRWATEGSARCLGREAIGAIAVGKQADLAFYTLDELRFSGAGDPLAALVLCGAHAAPPRPPPPRGPRGGDRHNSTPTHP